MTKQVINVGAVANDGTGDPLRIAFTKANDNFDELYSHDAASTEHEASTSNPHATTAAQVGADITTGTVHSAPAKGTPEDSDELPLLDSAGGFDVVKLTWSAVKSTLQNAFATVFSPLNHNHTGTYEPANANIQSHIGSSDNPHHITVEQIGAAPSIHDHDADYEPLNLNIQAHIGSSENPHSVTAAQVDAYTKDEVDQIIADSTDPRVGPHIEDTSNPHSVTAAQVGAYTSGAVDTLLSGKSDTTHNHSATYQPLDATLTALAGMATSANKVPLITGTDTVTAGQITSGYIATTGVAATNLFNGTACSVIGRSAASTGAQASIAAGTNGYVLRRTSNVLGFGLLKDENVDGGAAISWTKVSKTGATAADVGADAAGTAATAVSTHAAESDPHPAYAQNAATESITGAWTFNTPLILSGSYKYLHGTTAVATYKLPTGSSNTQVYPAAETSMLSGTTYGPAITRWSTTTTDSASLNLAKSRNATNGTYTAASSAGETLGRVNVYGGDGSNFVRAGSFGILADAAGTSGIVPGRYTIALTNASGTEEDKLIIYNDGGVALSNQIISTSSRPLLSASGRFTDPNLSSLTGVNLVTTISDGDITANRNRYGSIIELHCEENGIRSDAASVTVTGITSGSATTITFECAGHSFVANDMVQLTGNGATYANSFYRVASVVAGTSITCNVPSSAYAATMASGTLGVLKKTHGYSVAAYGALFRSYPGNGGTDGDGGSYNTGSFGSYNLVSPDAYGSVYSTALQYNTFTQSSKGNALYGILTGVQNVLPSAAGPTLGTGNTFDVTHGVYNQISFQNYISATTVYGTRNSISKAGTYAETAITTAYGTYTAIDNASNNGTFGAGYLHYGAFTGAGTALPTTKVGWYSTGESHNIFSGKVRIGDTATPANTLEVAGTVSATSAAVTSLTLNSVAVTLGADEETDLVRRADLGTAAFMDVEQVRRLSGDDTYWDDLVFEMTESKQGSSTKPDFDTAECGLLFPQNNATEIVYINVQMPHRWKQGSRIYPHVHCHQAANQQAVMKLDYRWTNIGGTVGSWTTGFTMNSYVATYTSGTIHQILDNTAGIDATGKTLSSILQIKLYRDDNVYTGDLLVTSFDIHHEVDGWGSENEYAKE